MNKENPNSTAILLFNKNAQLEACHPITQHFGLKLVGETQFDIYFSSNTPQMYKFQALDASSLWTCISCLTQLSKQLSNIDESLITDTSDKKEEPHIEDNFEWLASYQQMIQQENLTSPASPSVASPKGIRFSKARSNYSVRDLWIKAQMKEKSDEFTDLENMNIVCATYNVNMKYPTNADPSLSLWLQRDILDADIYMITLQEVDMSANAMLREVTEAKTNWDAFLRDEFPTEKYSMTSKQLVGLYVAVFVHKKHEPHLTNRLWGVQKVGALGIVGNKGGLIYRFDIHNSSFCLIGAHMAPHKSNVERRNQNYHSIIQRSDQYGDFPLAILKHDYVFWVGDLNYRVDVDYETAIDALKQQNYDSLLKHDQLMNEMKARRAFHAFQEGAITFPCTYKYDCGTSNYDTSEKKRIPAWTDRILYRKGSHVSQQNYDAYQSYLFSDHKPVSSLLTVNVEVIQKEKYLALRKQLDTILNKLEAEMLPEIKLSATELTFSNVQFDQEQEQEIKIKNTGQIVCEYSFIPKVNENMQISKNWIVYEPHAGILIPGETATIRIRVDVKEDSARMLTLKDDNLDDILVLHLKNGRDHFVSVQGNFIPTVFGLPINYLVGLSRSIRSEVKEKKHDLEVVYEKLPKELWHLVDTLYRRGVKEPRIFRSEGNMEECLQIRNLLDEGKSLDSYEGSMVSVAETLLRFVECFEEPVVPRKNFQACIDAAELGTEAVIETVSNFDEPAHFNCFHYLMAFGREVLVHSEENENNIDELSVTFAKILMRKPNDEYFTHEERSQSVLFVRIFLSSSLDWSKYSSLRDVEFK